MDITIAMRTIREACASVQTNLLGHTQIQDALEFVERHIEDQASVDKNKAKMEQSYEPRDTRKTN